MTKKNNFTIIKNEEEFDEHIQEKIKEDSEVLEFLQSIVDAQNHKQFNFAILNLGVLLQIVKIFFDLKENEMNDIMKIDNPPLRQRKLTIIFNELNEKINLKYDFDSETEIISQIFFYESECYIHINKILFLKLLLGTQFCKQE